MRTVYYVTNRVVTGDPTLWQSYSTDIIPPSDPSLLTYGTAFVDDSNLTADSDGSIASLQNVQQGQFTQDPIGDLSHPGCNLLFFIHGFANSFNDSITRAAYLQQWFTASGIAGANTKVLAFAWPSLGKEFSFPNLSGPYLRDQGMAGQSGVHLMDVLTRLRPIITTARAGGARIILLAHSMGHWVLQAGLTSWFLHGKGAAHLFEEAVLAAGDEIATTFASPPPNRLSDLYQLANRSSIYFSDSDIVLKLSVVANEGVARLGQDGPPHRTNPTTFPPARYRMVDCTNINDYDKGILDVNSHQYYRRSPAVRSDIAAVIAGALGDPATV
jgi:esterase/lipase superfamily enzyme